MKLNDIWSNDIEILFNEFPITKEIFFLKFKRFEIKFSKEIFEDFLTLHIKRHYVQLKNFENINELTKKINENSYGNKTTNTTTSNSLNNNANREIYTGFSVDGEFKRNEQEGSIKNDVNSIIINNSNPLDIYKAINNVKNFDLLSIFLNSCGLLFETIFTINI